MTQILSAERIGILCGNAAQQVRIQVVEQTGSTNADLLGMLDRLIAPTLLIARSQTAGRGRAGRSWLSAPGKSLTFSLAWKFDLPGHRLVGLPLAVGVAVAEALAMFHVSAGLKWPNDVMHEGRKLAGILIESTTAGAASRNGNWAVIGIGLNMAVSDDTVAEIGRPVASIPRLAELDQDLLVATLLTALVKAMQEFEREGLTAFVQKWNALHIYTGSPVNILDNGRVIHEGIAMGIDEMGRLLLDTITGRIAVMAGDVSLRPKEG